MFRAKIARAAPTGVIVVKKVKDGLTEEEKKAYLETFQKFDTDGGGAMDSSELGKLIRILGLEFSLSYASYNVEIESVKI